jgi:hypothetical protein
LWSNPQDLRSSILCISTTYKIRSYNKVLHSICFFIFVPSPLALFMRTRYLYLYIPGSLAITISCQNPSPNIVRSSMHACTLLFLPTVASLVHAFFPRIAFLSSLACFQQLRKEITGENDHYLSEVCANPNKDGQSKPNIINWELVRPSSNGWYSYIIFLLFDMSNCRLYVLCNCCNGHKPITKKNVSYCMFQYVD